MRLIQLHVFPVALRLAVLATTIGVLYAIADLFAPLIETLVSRKGIVMLKLALTTLLGLVFTTTAYAQPAERSSEMKPISNAFEIALGGGYMRGAGDIGHGIAPVEDLAGNGGGAELHVAYRESPHLSLGLYGTLSSYEPGHSVGAMSDLALGVSAGAEATWHYRPATTVDPWVSIGAGWRALWIGNDARTERALQGIELTRIQAGIDLRVTEKVAIAPYIGASATMYIAQDQMAGYEAIAGQQINWSVTGGLLARFDLDLR